jgi:hypothetical protein
MQDGYIKLYRKVLNSRVFANDGLFKLFMYCLLKANHKGRWVSAKTGRGDTTVWVEVGQFIFGRKTAAKELRCKPSTVVYRLSQLQRMEILDIQADTHWSIITIVNWNSYQGSEKKCDSHSDIQLAGNCHPTSTNKNVKNEKKEGSAKKRASLPPEKIQFSETHHRLAKEAGVDLKYQYEKFRDDRISKGVTYKDVNLGFNTWLRNCNKWDRNTGTEPTCNLQELD